VLHHMTDDIIIAIMEELRRITTDDAIVILREHDSPNHMMDSLINIEHGLFEVSIEKLTTGAEFQKNYYGKYKHKRDWIMNFNLNGFDAIGDSVSNTVGTRPFYQAFRKNTKRQVIVSKTIPELRTTARRLGIKLNSKHGADGIKRAIISGRR
jgi:hypothetical protein